MSSEENKSLVRHTLEEVWNKGNLDILDEIISPDFILHTAPPAGLQRTRGSIKQEQAAILNAFSERDFKLEDVIAEGDKVVMRWSFSGKHTAEFMGVPPTNKQVISSGITIVRIVGGKLVEQWVQADYLGLMQQLGLIPLPEH